MDFATHASCDAQAITTKVITIERKVENWSMFGTKHSQFSYARENAEITAAVTLEVKKRAKQTNSSNRGYSSGYINTVCLFVCLFSWLL